MTNVRGRLRRADVQVGRPGLAGGDVLRSEFEAVNPHGIGQRTQSLRFGPTRPYWSPSSFAIPQDFDGRGTGVDDDTSALQGMLSALANEDTATGMLPSGEWAFLQPLSVPGGVTIVGQGAQSRMVMPADAGWERPPSGKSRAALEIIGASHVVLRDLVMDGNGATRESTHPIGQFVLVNNAHHVLIENVTFRGGGRSTGSPTGPYIQMVALDALDDLDDFPTAEVGGVTYCAVRGCTFESSGAGDYAFGIRLLTNWDKKRPYDDWVHTIEANEIIGNRFPGASYTKDTIELAGGGTRKNWVARNYFDGRACIHIDIDKGADQNVVTHNIIASGGRPDSALSDPGTRAHGIAVHGNVDDYRTNENIISHNLIYNIDNPGDTDPLQSGIMVGWANGTLVQGNIIRNVAGGQRGYGILLEDTTPDTTIIENLIYRTFEGVGFDGSDTARDGVVIANNHVDCANRTIHATGPASATAHIAIRGNRLTTSSTGNYALSLSGEYRALSVDGNHVAGGEAGLYMNASGGIVVGNTFRGGARGIRALRGDTTYRDNDAGTAALAFTAQYTDGVPLCSGNSWQRDIYNPASSLTLNGTEGVVRVSANASARTITLPDMPTSNELVIFKSDPSSNTVTIQASGDGSINGASSIVLTSQWESVRLRRMNNGAWFVIGRG